MIILQKTIWTFLNTDIIESNADYISRRALLRVCKDIRKLFV